MPYSYSGLDHLYAAMVHLAAMIKLTLGIYIWLLGEYLVVQGTIANSIIVTGEKVIEYAHVGESISLQCVPSKCVRNAKYFWRTSAQDILSLSSTSRDELSDTSTLILRIDEDFPPVLRVFCHVLSSSDNSTVSVEMIKLQVRGIITSATDSGLYSGIVGLTAKWDLDYSSRRLVMNTVPRVQWFFSNVTENSSIIHPWYFNSTSITLRKNARVSRVTLEEPDNRLSGLYKADLRILIQENSGCSEYGEGNSACSEAILPLLMFSAITRPVAYLVKANGEMNTFNVTEAPLLKLRPENVEAYPSILGTFSERFEITLVPNRFLNYKRANLILDVFFNGIKLGGTSDQTLREINNEILYHGRNSATYTYELIELVNASKAIVNLTISNVRKHNFGIYEIIFTVPKDKVNLGCCSDHENFIQSTDGMNLHNYIVGLASVELKNADAPPLTVFASKSNHSKEEYTSLSCTIDLTRSTNFKYVQWKKGAEYIAYSSTTSATLQVETTGGTQFGEFECVANNGFANATESILISESVRAAYTLRPVSTSRSCNVSGEVQQFMTQIIVNIMSGLCSCQITTANLFDQSTSCEAGGITTFHTSLAYSNADGSQTASDLLMLADTWITGRRNVNGAYYDIESSQTRANQEYIFTAAVFTAIVFSCITLGVLIGLTLSCVFIKIICTVRKRPKKPRKTRVSVTMMANNVAILKKLHPLPPVQLSRPQPAIQVFPSQYNSRSSVSPPSQQISDQQIQKPRKFRPIVDQENKSPKTSDLSTVDFGRSSMPPSYDEEPILNIKSNVAYRKTSSTSPEHEKERDGDSGSGMEVDTVQYDYARVSCSVPNNIDLEDSASSEHYMN